MSYYYRSPYVSTVPYRREYTYEYTTEGNYRNNSDRFENTWLRPSDEYLYWKRPGVVRYPRYFPVDEWIVPTTSYEVRRRPLYSSYYPEYTTLTSPSIYSPRLYSTTPSASRTVIRSGPYGVTTRTYRY